MTPLAPLPKGGGNSGGCPCRWAEVRRLTCTFKSISPAGALW